MMQYGHIVESFAQRVDHKGTKGGHAEALRCQSSGDQEVGQLLTTSLAGVVYSPAGNAYEAQGCCFGKRWISKLFSVC